MKDNEKKKPTVHDLAVYLREGFYLPADRQEYQFKNKTGYTLSDQDDLVGFISELKNDFEGHILPFLEKIFTIQDCINAFGQITFWGNNLTRVITENGLVL